ncbi:ATP-binding protein [Sphingobacterium spiritivorum]
MGGIHGVGKSTICQRICRELDMEYLSASELLKWKDINEDSKNKKVEDIPYTQNRLIGALKNTVQKHKFYILDGHYCLLNKYSKIENISLDTFKQINPYLLCLILGDISEIKNRLEARDNKPYEYALLKHLQNSELTYAKSLSKMLIVPLQTGKSDDYLNILDSIRKTNKK